MHPFDINLFRCLTLRRIKNLFNTVISYYRHFLVRKYNMLGIPPIFSIEPTNLCNLHCLQCPTGRGELTRAKGEMNFFLYRDIIESLQDYIIYLLLYFQGEPMLHKDIISMIELARKHNIYVVLNTNGHFIKNDELAESLVNSGLNGIIFSIDGASEESYIRYRRGGNFNVVIEGIERLIKTKLKMKSKNPKIYLQFIVMKHNQDEIKDMKKLGKKLKVNKILFKSVQVYDKNNYNILIPSMTKFNRYKKVDDGLVLKSGLKNCCKRILFTSVITWDGFVIPCCFDKNADFSFGKFDNCDSFKKILNSQKAIEFRKSVFTERKNISICLNCAE